MAARIALPTTEDRRPVRSRSRRRHRPFFVVLLLVASFYALYSSGLLSAYSTTLPTSYPSADSASASGPDALEPNVPGRSESVDLDVEPTEARQRVPLEAHIMSKCPDAKDCLKEMILPAMIRVVDKVNFTLSYIGTPTVNDGVQCKHGPAECMGNIIELCAQELYWDPKIWLGFTMCLTRDYSHIPQRELVQDCALEHAVDFDKLNECATRDDGAFGMSMLRRSVERTESVCSLDPSLSSQYLPWSIHVLTDYL
ncbi:hypothetical protein F5Y18DRAFT_86703 [Xylariaceae sp. FL1019]|nr:hypothetical protein F5Y18DRAFT_86703 [Xylariaceae sp. FL1019]